MSGDLPVVAIVGRPNVGKSTLLNRIVGKRVAIVEEKPGVTRDRKEVEAEWNGRPFLLVDTGGWMAKGSELDQKVSDQSEQALREADVVLFVVDSTLGVTEDDARVGQLLRSVDSPVMLIANKVDDRVHEAGAWELMSLGLGEPFTVSALHGRGMGDLLDAVVAELPEMAEDDDEELPEDADRASVCSVALVGRPNVGKSTLFNRLIGENRSVVHDMPGTTRDAVDTVVETDIGPLRFVDTAGMRRRSKIDEGTEYFSMVRALRAVDESDVALLVIDATEGITHQDQRLAERVDGAGCPIVVLLNKWELLDADQRAEVTGKGVHRLLPALEDAIAAYHTRVPTRQVNDVVRRAQQAQPAPHGARILYATQGASDPPTFTLFTNKEIPPSYVRYIERQLSEAFKLGATPLKLRVRPRAR